VRERVPAELPKEVVAYSLQGIGNELANWGGSQPRDIAVTSEIGAGAI